MDERPDPAVTLADAARRINAHDDLATTLTAIVSTGRLLVPTVDAAGISLGSRPRTLASSAAAGTLAADMESLQLELGEGPAPAALEVAETVASPLRHEQRWPGYVAQAVRRGLCSQLSLRLHVEDEVLGVLSLYSRSTDVLDDAARDVAEAYAAQAALALRRVRREEQLALAMQGRKVIGQAIGIVMERYAMDEDRAFQYISRLSQDGNVKLRDLAQQLVSERNSTTEPAPEA